MRYFAIGDIHGHSEELHALLRQICDDASYNPTSDHLILLGDLVDNGPNSKEVVEWVMFQKKLFPDTFHPLKGNHDDFMVDALKYNSRRYKSWDLWFRQGGKQTIQSYLPEGSDYEKSIMQPKDYIPQSHLDFLDSLPVAFWTKDYFFVHGGVPSRPLAAIEEELSQKVVDPDLEYELMWIREEFYDSHYKWGKRIIFAHTGFPSHETGFWEPYVRDTMIGINTMPRNDGKLTCLVLNDNGAKPEMYFQEKI